MRLGLSQHLRAEQRLSQSPQMIQAMHILQKPMAELQDHIEQELQENVFLEVKEEDSRDSNGERSGAESGAGSEGEQKGKEEPDSEKRLQDEFSRALDQLESRVDGSGNRKRTAAGEEEGERRLEALYNTPGPDISLAEHLLSQIRLQGHGEPLYSVIEHVVFSLDADARLKETAEEIAKELLIPLPLAQNAIDTVRSLEPAGVAAADLRDCLLMQLERLPYVRPLTHTLVEQHLNDLATNKLPRVAKATQASIEDIKDSLEFIRSHLNPHPGSRFAHSHNSVVIPDVLVEEVDGEFEVRTQRGSLPELSISPMYRKLLQEAKSDKSIYEYLKRKIEGARWFIEAVHQRQSTIQRIASEIVKRQQDFLREGVRSLRPMKMQDIADEVGVHISTVSRAISGKYIQTPQGIFDMKRFFSGGTLTEGGEMMSQQAVKDVLKEIIDNEDKSSPMSDDQLVEALKGKGVQIARRTVTKYRKVLGIESSTRRREF